jgi:hypothetical protein
LIIYDSLVANQYYQDFSKRLTDAGGTLDINRIGNEVPALYSLEQNYPNPFNPKTNIRYSIPENSFVTLKIFDLLGREIKTLVNQNQISGKYSITFDMSGYASGLYLYKIQAGNFSDTRKMILIK